MRRLFRQPLTWMVLGEIAVVAVLIALAWHVMLGGSASIPPLILPDTSLPDRAAAPSVPPGVLVPPSPGARTLLPGLNIDPTFWRTRLAALNQAEAQLEALEWRIVHSAMDTVHRYVESVVVPAVEHAERRGG